MVTTATLKRQIKAAHNTTRGSWVKVLSNYYTDAFESIYTTDGEGYINGCTTLSTYQIMITREDGRWYFYAEEHEISDLDGFQPENGFKTLREAKEAAEEFGRYFEECWKECEGIE